jgi:hypothetical protein
MTTMRIAPSDAKERQKIAVASVPSGDARSIGAGVFRETLQSLTPISLVSLKRAVKRAVKFTIPMNSCVDC